MIADSLRISNTWWQTGNVESGRLHKRIRSEFAGILQNEGNRKILLLSGPRRVGKTSLLFQAAHQLLAGHVVPRQNVLYFSGSDLSLSIPKYTIRDILTAYCNEILNRNFEQLRERLFILVDDVHLFADWQLYLRYFFERGYPIKFIVTAPQLSQATEGFVQICTDVRVEPLSFLQFAELYCANRETSFDLISYKSLLPYDSLFFDPAGYYETLQANFSQLTQLRAGKTRLIREYLLAGGYPAFFSAPSLPEWHRRLSEDLVEHTLYRDILERTNVKSPEVLRKLLFIIASLDGEEHSYASIAKLLQIDTVTTISYIAHLASCGLVINCENLSSNKSGVVRKNRRLYIADCGLRNALLRRTALATDDLGGLTVINCMAMARDYAYGNRARLGFWRNNRADFDILLQRPGGGRMLPIRIEQRGTAPKRGLREFAALPPAENGLPPHGVCITDESLRRERIPGTLGWVYFIPGWLL